ncbi:MAG: YigZ family protein [Firmicutes bacterium]|nr:YigZ family protein [Bacillota bacterium]MDI6707296.1 YigZ family protein [Bacillota bacterium]
MQLTSYFTVKGYGEQEIVIQKSRFIAQVTRASTEEEAQGFIKSIKKKYWDASHNCFAYVIGEHSHIQKANDDGEPGGTAGVPILEVIRKRDLKDTVVVVTRYFGGIKLGAGGLIRAYGRAAAEGIDAAGVVERKLMSIMSIEMDYPWLGKVENELGSSPYMAKETQYLEKVKMYVYVTSGEEARFNDWVANLTNGQAEARFAGEEYVEISQRR